MNEASTPATCTEDAFTVYTATYGEHTDSKTVTDENTKLGHDFTEAWDWASDMSTATLKLECECGEFVELAAEITTEENADGTTTFIANAEYDGKTYTDSKEVPIEQPAVKAELYAGNTVTFAENIMLNFLGDIDESVADGAYVVFTYNHYGEEVTVRVDLNKGLKTGKYYRFGCPLTASELGIEVKAELFLADSDEAVSEFSRSVRNYLIAQLDRTDITDTQKNAMRALLNYGGWAQKILNLNTDFYANEDYTLDLSDLEIVCENEFDNEAEKASDEGGIHYIGAALQLKDQTNIVWYFDAAEDSGINMNDVTVQISYKDDNDNTITKEAEIQHNKSGYFVISDPNRARRMDTVHEVTFYVNGEAVRTINFCVLNYAQIKSDPNNSNNTADYIEAMKALYNYYDCALKYYIENTNH